MTTEGRTSSPEDVIREVLRDPDNGGLGGRQMARAVTAALAGWLREADQTCRAVECDHRTEWECLADILDPQSAPASYPVTRPPVPDDTVRWPMTEERGRSWECGDPYSGIGCPEPDCTHQPEGWPNSATMYAEGQVRSPEDKQARLDNHYGYCTLPPDHDGPCASDRVPRHNLIASDCAVSLDDPKITVTTASEHCAACAADRLAAGRVQSGCGAHSPHDDHPCVKWLGHTADHVCDCNKTWPRARRH